MKPFLEILKMILVVSALILQIGFQEYQITIIALVSARVATRQDPKCCWASLSSYNNQIPSYNNQNRRY